MYADGDTKFLNMGTTYESWLYPTLLSLVCPRSADGNSGCPESVPKSGHVPEHVQQRSLEYDAGLNVPTRGDQVVGSCTVGHGQ